MNNFYPYYNNFNGYGWNPQAQQPKIPTMNQLMTDDERKLIESQGAGLNVERTPIDQARSKCTHKHPSHGLTIFEHKDSGLWECTQCHKVFNIKDWSNDEVIGLVQEMTDVIDNIKLFIPYIAPQTGTSLYMAYDMIETIPRLYKYALEYKKKMWSSIDAAHNPLRPDQQMNTLNMFNAIQNGGMPYYGNTYGYGGMQMPNAQNGYMTPNAPSMMQNGYPMSPAYQNMQQQPQMNPMGFNQPNPMGMPQNGPVGMPNSQPIVGFPNNPLANNPQIPSGMSIPTQQPQMNPGYPVPGMFQDRPVGVVDPTAIPGGAFQPQQQQVVQNQVATAGPTPLANTQANVPPAAAPVSTSDVKKSFKA